MKHEPVDESPQFRGRVVEAAPARRRIRHVAALAVILFAALGARAVHLALLGPKPSAGRSAPTDTFVARADLVDRNGVLLASTVPRAILTAEPGKIADAEGAAVRIASVLPDIDVAVTAKRIAAKNRELVYLKRDLTQQQRAAIQELGLPGLGFRPQTTRVYPNGQLAAHLLGLVNYRGEGVAGAERGLDKPIREDAGGAVRLSLDVRVQYALESELERAAKLAAARGGAGLVMDGRTGEVLGFASWPSFDVNNPPGRKDPARLNRVAGAVYEMGSTLKPFTLATALESAAVGMNDMFDVAAPLRIEDATIHDLEPFDHPAGLREILSKSSNIGAAQIALKTGAARQRAALKALGLLDRPPIELPESARPILPSDSKPLTVAVLGYGHGIAVSLLALADAYTVFANDGVRAPPTILARDPGETPKGVRVYSAKTARAVLAMMREAVVSGTAKRAEEVGLEIAGKTGTAEKPGKSGYDPDRMVSSFAAVFPGSAPRYVIVLALDEPERTEAVGRSATGGAVAAPAVGRIAARIAPMLGVTPTPARN